MDEGGSGNKQQEKKLFSIPSAKEIARLEHGKSRVKSYFRSQFGNQLSKNKAASSSEKNELNASSTNGASSSAVPSKSDSETTRGTGSCEGTSSVTGGKSMVTAASGSTEPSISVATRGETVGAKRKIGSAFVDKFAAVKEEPDYEEPVVKKSVAPVSTAVLAAPIATGAKAPSGANTIIVNTRQRGNPILKHVRNVPWEFGDIVPDYVMGRTVCALYLSLRYHHLNPNYIHDRLKDLGHQYELRVLLVQVDVKDPHHSLKELAQMALMADCTLILAWSPEEAGRYLETYKSYENKPADALKEKVDADYVSKVTDVLSTVKSVNKTDVVTLMSTFGTFDKILAASKEDLYLCPGFGPQKAQRLYDVLHEPFLKAAKDGRKAAAATETTAATTSAASAAAVATAAAAEVAMASD